MNTDEYARAIAHLSPKRREVFNSVRALGGGSDEDLVEAMGASRSEVIPRRSDLVHLGLVRGAGSRATAAGRKTTIWEIVPPEEVEGARDVAEQRGPRRQEIRKWSMDDKVRVTRALLRDRAVRDALEAANRSTSQRQRARDRKVIAKDRRDRAMEIKNAGELITFLKVKDIVKRNIEALREVGFYAEEDREREIDGRPPRIPDWAWAQVAELVDETIEVAETLSDALAERTGAPVRSAVRVIEERIPNNPERPIKVVGESP